MYDFHFVIDGEEWKAPHLERLEYERNLHTLHQLYRHGIDIVYKGRNLNEDDIDYLTYDEAWAVSVDTRAQCSGEKIIEHYRDSLKKSDEFWKALAFGQDKPMKVSRCYMKVNGLTLENYWKIMKMLSDDERIGLSVHPEHFIAMMNDEKIYGIEPFGMYGTPTLCLVRYADVSELGPQIQADIDPAYTRVMAGRAYLTDGVTEINSPCHQFRDTGTGMEAKMAVYWPENTPDEVASGHCLHLAMEFYGGLKQLDKVNA